MDKYYKMSDAELKNEAARWNIKGYEDRSGRANRSIIIDQLITKDRANNSRYAIFLSLIALLVSILILIFK
ncbi:hypothetical protein KJ853_00920 [Patescibacteria group bacterium]|nr:hypothetical protein [Patescibacteria group bacterium]